MCDTKASDSWVGLRVRHTQPQPTNELHKLQWEIYRVKYFFCAETITNCRNCLIFLNSLNAKCEKFKRRFQIFYLKF